MIKKLFLILALFVGMIISTTRVEAAPLLSNPYIIPTDANDEVGKEIPLNLVNLRYVGEDIKTDVLLNDKVVKSLSFWTKKNDTIIIKNMGKYKQEAVDLNITTIDRTFIEINENGMLSIRVDLEDNNKKGTIKINVYKHNTKIIYPDLYIGLPYEVLTNWNDYIAVDVFDYQNLYGLYLPKKLGTLLSNADVTQHDGLLDIRYGKGSKIGEMVYPIFRNNNNGSIIGSFYSSGLITSRLNLFDPSHPSPIPIPYEGVNALNTTQEAKDITSLDVHYIVTQKLANYVSLSHYPTDQTFKIKTNFKVDSSEDVPVEAVVKLADNQLVDKKYYSSVFLNNSHEVTFSSDFLEEYKGELIKIDYKQRLDSEKLNLVDYYNMDEKAFIFPYSSENKWERRGEHFKQQELSIGQTTVNFPIELGAKILNGEKVIQNKSTDDYDPLDFVSDLTSNLPGDSVSATFTKKIIFQNIGRLDIYITLKSSLSSATKDIVLVVNIIEGTLHFTEVPSELTFPTIALTGKMIDYEVSSFSKGRLSVLDDRLTSSPWSLTATLTDNKSPNNFGDILYFRDEAGAIYNITNETQNVMTNRSLELTKTIIDYEQNKQTGLFIRVNPLFVKKGAYEGNVTWSLVDAPG